MSDFTSDFWHLYVGGLTLVSILACLILLWISGTTKANTHADNTTGHVWDGDLAEMNNPLPRWWVYLFVITVIFALAYGALYPMFGKFQGVLGWTSRGQHTAEVAKVEAAIAPIYAKFSGMTPEQMAGDSEAMAIGERLFIAPGTVEVHRRNIMRKLDMHNLAALTKYAIREGLVTA